MLRRPPSCEGCPANGTARGFVPPSGNTNARMVLVGQGPTGEDAIYDEPFVGPVGQTLDRWLVRAGVPREALAIGHIVQCQLPGGRAPRPREVQHCWRAHVRPWLSSLTNARVVAPVGIPAMEALLGAGATSSVAGTLQPLSLPWPEEPYGRNETSNLQPLQSRAGAAGCELPEVHADGAPLDMDNDGGGDGGGVRAGRDECDGLVPISAGTLGAIQSHSHPTKGVQPSIVLAPILHPLNILRGQWALEPAQVRFLKRAWETAQQDTPVELPDVRKPPAGCLPTPTLEEVERYVADTMDGDSRMACDIEGTQGRLIGIGFCRLRDERAIYIPFLDADQAYWPEEDWARVDTAIRTLLTAPLVFHNGQAFDIPFLESCGYEVPNYLDDTMIRHHILYAEMGKSLEELAILYCGMSSWKWLSKLETEADGK